jgi:hypothetical protein
MLGHLGKRWAKQAGLCLYYDTGFEAWCLYEPKTNNRDDAIWYSKKDFRELPQPCFMDDISKMRVRSGIGG